MTCAGILLALMAGAPVVADDTELLLVTPSTAQDLKPNILLIIDTSTSMDSVEETIEPYDSALSYAGVCDVDRVCAGTLAAEHPDSVRRAGFEGEGPVLGNALFRAILDNPNGVVITSDPYEVTMERIRTDDGRIELAFR